MSELSLFEVLFPEPLFDDRRDAGRRLATLLERERGTETVVLGLARGGVETAAEVAEALAAPLDAIAARKIRHPLQPEYALGAVVAGGGVYLRAHDGLTDEQLAGLTARAQAEAAALDERLHAVHPPLEVAGTTAVIVDDGLATGATMIAALGWARAAGAARVVAAVPVGAPRTVELVAGEADAIVCPFVLRRFVAVGVWYRSFDQLTDEDVIALLARNRRERRPGGAGEGAGARRCPRQGSETAPGWRGRAA